MKTKSIFALLMTLAILASCSPALQATPIPAFPTPTQIKTPTLLPTQQTAIYKHIPYKITTTVLSPTMRPITLNPIIGPSSTPLPTFIPYPTASMVSANVVTFIEKEYWTGDLSLWVANVDGSGERKLTYIEKNDEWVSHHLLQWSPDGKWIGYISGDDLWIISPDGSKKRRLLSIQETNKKIVRQYTWSPDSSKIVYALAANWGDFTEIKTGLLDLAAEKDSKLFSYQSPATITLSWSPNGRYLLLNQGSSFFVYEAASLKIVKEIKSTNACWTTWHDGVVWSPNSEWFFHLHHSNGRYAINWICVSGVDGSNHRVDIDGTIAMPVWDKAGNSLYFAARKTNPDGDPNLKIDKRLMRYDVRTQKADRLLSFKGEFSNYDLFGQMSLSPDQHTLVLSSQTSETQLSLETIDFQTLLTKNYFTLDFNTPILHPTIFWSADNQNIIINVRKADTSSSMRNYKYSHFYLVNIETGKATLFSGKHQIESWAVSPIATTP